MSSRFGEKVIKSHRKSSVPPKAARRPSAARPALHCRLRATCAIIPERGGRNVEGDMCDLCARADGRTLIARRNVLKLGMAAAAAMTGAPHAFAATAKAPPKPENVLSPDDALARLMKGNERYVEGVSRRHDFKHEREALSGGQNPFAAVLSCADSRIAPEYCFDTARGDLFVCRVAGNYASDDIIASLEYAVQVLNAPLIMVLGHQSCGAVDATIKSVKDGTTIPGQLLA